MGILDFREICSPNANHKSVKNSPLGKSNLPDDFELFCEEFFSQVKKFSVFKSVSNGPDGGIDLGVEQVEGSKTTRWLVSCKHYAHSNTYVNDIVQRNIVETVKSWGCDGFIPFYTTVPTTTLSRHIEGAEKVIKVERYYKEKIEQELLSTSQGINLAARYFPKSLINHYQQFIKESEEHSAQDVEMKDGVATLDGFQVYVGHKSEQEKLKSITELVKFANINSGFKSHRPYFEKALNDANNLYPHMFKLESGHLSPSREVADLYRLAYEDGLSKAYFIGAIWSFGDYKKANRTFAEFRVVWGEVPFLNQNLAQQISEIRNESWWKEKLVSVFEDSLLTPGLLGIKLQDRERDILARCLAYANPM